MGAKITPDRPARALAAASRTKTSRPVLAMRTEIPRARAMTRTTDIMSAAPVMKVLTICFSDRPPMIPIRTAMRKNQVEASSKYHWPMGRPVIRADQP